MKPWVSSLSVFLFFFPFNQARIQQSSSLGPLTLPGAAGTPQVLRRSFFFTSLPPLLLQKPILFQTWHPQFPLPILNPEWPNSPVLILSRKFRVPVLWSAKEKISKTLKPVSEPQQMHSYIFQGAAGSVPEMRDPELEFLLLLSLDTAMEQRCSSKHPWVTPHGQAGKYSRKLILMITQSRKT